MLKKIPLILSIYIAFIFLQSLFFKFAGWFGEPADITVYIFRTVGQWMNDGLGLAFVGDAFSRYGDSVIGLLELTASVLVLISRTRLYGAVVAIAVMSGAIFFHVFTPLGLFPYTDLDCLQAGCPQEYPLFFMAVGVWLSAAYLIFKERNKLPFFNVKSA